MLPGVLSAMIAGGPALLPPTNREIFVGPGGNNANPGTAGSPKATLAGALAVSPALGAGDIVTYLDGTYVENLIVTLGGSAVITGTYASNWDQRNYLTIRAQNRGGALIRPTGGNHGIQIQKDWVLLDGFDVSGPALLYHGIAADWLNGTSGAGGSGDRNYLGVHHIWIQYCIPHDNTISGIGLAYGDYYLVEYNHSYNNCYRCPKGIQGSGISIYQARAATSPVSAFADEFSSLSLDTAANGSANWATYFVTWNVHTLGGNNDKAFKTWSGFNPGGGGRTPAAMNLGGLGADSLHQVSSGTLTLRGWVNPDATLGAYNNGGLNGYIGGMITGDISGRHTYGTWEVRAKFTMWQGCHWSIWMVTGANTPGGIEWPEIDLVELVHDAGFSVNKLYIGSHGDLKTPRTVYGDTVPTSSVPAYVPLATSAAWQDWHTYKFVWTPAVMEWWVDGVKRLSCANFIDDPMYLMISPEMGGTFAGGTVDTANLPTVGEIDYARYTSYTFERVLPVSRQASTNLKDSANTSPPALIGDVDELPTASDGLWWTAVNAGLDTSARIRMATPSGSLTGVQSLRALLRKTAGGSPPATLLRLWQNGVPLSPQKTVSVSSTTGQVETLEFDASAVTGNAAIELEITGTAAASGFAEVWTGTDGAAWNSLKWPTVEVGNVTGNTSTATIQTNRGRMVAQGTSSSFHWVRAKSPADTSGDLDITLKFTLLNVGVEQYHSIHYRASGQSTLRGTDPANAYTVTIYNGNLLWRSVKNSVRGTDITVPKTWVAGTQYSLRISITGTNHRVRVWTGTEPSTWDIDQADASSPVTTGSLWLLALNGSSSGTARTVDWDDLAVTPSGGATTATVEIGAVDFTAQTGTPDATIHNIIHSNRSHDNLIQHLTQDSNRALNLIIAVDPATDKLSLNNPPTNASIVRFVADTAAGGILPAGLTAGTNYYITNRDITATPDTFQVSTSSSGTPIVDLTDAGLAPFYVEPDHTDANGIILDDFRNSQDTAGSESAPGLNDRPYIHSTLVENNLCYQNGNRGIHAFKSDYLTIKNNTCYKNNLDTLSQASWRDELSNAYGSHNRWANNIGYVVGTTVAGQTRRAIGDRDDGNAYPQGRNVDTIWANNLTYDETTPASTSFIMSLTRADATLTEPPNLFAENPQFTNAGAFDFTLQNSSPAKDAGTAIYGLATSDLAGNPRVFGSAVDIGCYENQGGGTGLGAVLKSDYTLDGATTSNGTAPDSVSNVTGTVVPTWTRTDTDPLVTGETAPTRTSLYKVGGPAAITLPASAPAHACPNGVTISFYYQPTALAAKQVLFACTDDSSTGLGDCTLEIQTTGALSGGIRYDANPSVPRAFFGGSLLPGVGSLAVGTAYRITMFFGLAGAWLKINGTTISSIPGPLVTWNNNRVKNFGIWQDGFSGPMAGVIDRIRIWDGQISDATEAALEAPHSITITTGGGATMTAASVPAFQSNRQNVTLLIGWPSGRTVRSVVTQGSYVHGYVRRSWRPPPSGEGPTSATAKWMDFQAGWRKTPTGTPDSIVVELDDGTQATIQISVTHALPSGTQKFLDATAPGGGDGSSGAPWNSWSTAIANIGANQVLVVKAPNNPTVYSTSGNSGGPSSTANGVKIVADPTDLAAGRRPRIHVQGGLFAKYADQLNSGHWTVDTDLGGNHGKVWKSAVLSGIGPNVGCAYRTKSGRLRRCYSYTNTPNTPGALARLRDTTYARCNTNPASTSTTDFDLYLGPGIYVHSDDRLYIRLTPLSGTKTGAQIGARQVNGSAGVGGVNGLPWDWSEDDPADVDPNNVQLFISCTDDTGPNSTSDGTFGVSSLINRALRINSTNNWTLENLDFVGGGNTIDMRYGGGHTLRGCRFLGWAPAHYHDEIWAGTVHRRHFMMDAVMTFDVVCERCEFWGGAPVWGGGTDNKQQEGAYPAGATSHLFYHKPTSTTETGGGDVDTTPSCSFTFRNCIIEGFWSLTKSGGRFDYVKLHNNHMRYTGLDGLLVTQTPNTHLTMLRNHMCGSTLAGYCSNSSPKGTFNYGYNLLLNFRPFCHYHAYWAIVGSGFGNKNSDNAFCGAMRSVFHENAKDCQDHFIYNNTSIGSTSGMDQGTAFKNKGDGSFNAVVNDGAGAMLWPCTHNERYKTYMQLNNILAVLPNGSLGKWSTDDGNAGGGSCVAVVMHQNHIGFNAGGATSYSMDYNMYFRDPGTPNSLQTASGIKNNTICYLDSSTSLTEFGTESISAVRSATGQEQNGSIADPKFTGIWQSGSWAAAQLDNALFDIGFWMLQATSPARTGGNTTSRSWPDVDFQTEITYSGSAWRGALDPDASAVEQAVGPLGPLPSGL